VTPLGRPLLRGSLIAAIQPKPSKQTSSRSGGFDDGAAHKAGGGQNENRPRDGTSGRRYVDSMDCTVDRVKNRTRSRRKPKLCFSQLVDLGRAAAPNLGFD
jgi:hypothetical protein